VSSGTFRERICPWCGQAKVFSLTEDGLTRALVAHLERCEGEAA